MQIMRFSLDISSERYLAYYQGSAKYVWVVSEDGRSLKFPAALLQKFVTHGGVQGRFEISFNEQNKLVGMRRI